MGTDLHIDWDAERVADLIQGLADTGEIVKESPDISDLYFLEGMECVDSDGELCDWQLRYDGKDEIKLCCLQDEDGCMNSQREKDLAIHSLQEKAGMNTAMSNWIPVESSKS